MLKWIRKKKYTNCMCEDYCPCETKSMIRCTGCKFYRMIDSGYGNCIALPVATIVPWCKIRCSLFEVRIK